MRLVASGQYTNKDIGRIMGVHPGSVSRWLKQHRQKLSSRFVEEQQSTLETLVTEMKYDLARLGQLIDELQSRWGRDPEARKALQMRERLERGLARLLGLKNWDNPLLQRREKPRPRPSMPLWF